MIYILIPVYNEEKNILNLFNELNGLVLDQPVLFVFSDDGSHDHSITLINEHFTNTSFMVLSDGVNRGPGGAFNIGFEWILKHSVNDNDIVVTMEADCTSDINLLPNMLKIHVLGYDLVLASVYIQGGGFEGTSFLRKIISSIANLLFRFIFDLKIQTLSSFYRVYGLSLLQRIKEKNGQIITENGFICMLEILLKAIRVKASVIEVPMLLKSNNRIGKSKMKLLKTTWAYLSFLVKKK